MNPPPPPPPRSTTALQTYRNMQRNIVMCESFWKERVKMAIYTEQKLQQLLFGMQQSGSHAIAYHEPNHDKKINSFLPLSVMYLLSFLKIYCYWMCTVSFCVLLRLQPMNSLNYQKLYNWALLYLFPHFLNYGTFIWFSPFIPVDKNKQFELDIWANLLFVF